mmetsp:Transcript_38795/g.116635  ORF Transcript_38795/g.116635 Transcript_38795/m.116635 type:complete len:94 (-) Transcript_38795:1753-2034(-)
MASTLSLGAKRVPTSAVAVAASLSARRAVAAAASAARHLSSGGETPSVDYEHYASGWNIGDLAEFTKPGKYQIQTFNKISEKVRSWYCPTAYN